MTGTLTDGTGVSKLLASKVFKDLVADFLLTAPAVFVVLNVANLESALTVPASVGLGLADAAIRVIYRALIRWTQSSRVA
jgi:hypothetical protein